MLQYLNAVSLFCRRLLEVVKLSNAELTIQKVNKIRRYPSTQAAKKLHFLFRKLCSLRLVSVTCITL